MSMKWAIAVVAILSATPAYADWSYTQWGDTVDAVIAKSGGAATSVKGKDGDRVLGMDWRAKGSTVFEGLALDTLFFFDRKSHRLGVVKLTPSDPATCDALQKAAVDRYGTPESAEDGEPVPGLLTADRRWHDKPSNLAISFNDLRFKSGAMHLCHVIYRPFDAVDWAID